MNAMRGNLIVNNPEPALLAINTIRTLTIDAVQKANSGHPGAAMALAPLVYTLWNRIMRFDPADPIWPNRDRFVLSNGHASMLHLRNHVPGKNQSDDAHRREHPKDSGDRVEVLLGVSTQAGNDLSARKGWRPQDNGGSPHRFAAQPRGKISDMINQAGAPG